MNKKLRDYAIPVMLIFALGSCSSNPTGLNISEKGPYDFLDGIELDYENGFFDDFKDGVNPKNWYICKSSWGTGNGGVIPENVMYTDDGILVLRGNGLYYSDTELKGIGDLTDGRNTGGALISTFDVAPGHYEIKMRPLPRLGACTAFWTYAYKILDGEEADNHEIDIELPGGASEGVPTFKRLIDTNWTKVSAKDSTDIVVSDFTEGKLVNLNDGEFHTFGFDWYTDPMMVVYYVDGYITHISDVESLVPSMSGKLWLGAWFATTFAGRASFETDYLLVDYVSYVPFLNQPYTVYSPNVSTEIANKDEYPTYPVSLPISNYASNGNFEFFDRMGTKLDYGWEYKRLKSETKTVDEVAYLEKGVGYLGSVGAVIKDGGIIANRIDSIYEGMSYSIKFKAQSTSKNSALIIDYLDGSSELIESKYFYITSETLADFTGEFTAPKGCDKIDITICNETGEVQTTIIDDIVMNKI